MFILFNTKAQALNYIKRNSHLTYNYDEGCGCCYCFGSLFLDGNKLVKSNVSSHAGNIKACATVIGRIKNGR